MRLPDSLLRFVHDALAAGSSREAVAAALQGAGWTAAEIDAALAAWADSPGLPPVPVARAAIPVREVLGYALIFFLLGAVAVQVVFLGFGLIELTLPDKAETWVPQAASLRWPMAVLLPTVPLLLWLDRRTRSDGRPREVFVAAAGLVATLVLLGDLVGILYALLAGEITLRFVAKAALIAAMALLVLGYLRGPQDRRFLWALAGLAVAALAGGFALAGGPGQGRAEARDNARDADLRALSHQVSCRAGIEKKLPETLGVTPECPMGTRMADPFTGAPYSYTPLDGGAYRLCAAFETPAPDAGTAIYSARDANGCITERVTLP